MIGREVAPGVSVEPDGTLHLDLPRMCIANGYAPTRANQDIIERVAREKLKEAQFEVVADNDASVK